MKNVEDLYPLSPMQKMMLLHSETTRTNDALFNQFLYVIEGELDVASFEKSWQQLVDTHPILRTAFVWEGLREPLQAVRKSAVLPFELMDWRGTPASAREDQLDRLCAEDLEQGFDLSKAPVMRVKLIRYGPDEFRIVWSSHHLLLDRWCLPLALDQLGRFYLSNRTGQGFPREPARPFRDYIRWIQKQDPGEARRFWCQALAGVTQSTPLATKRAMAKENVIAVDLPEDATGRVRDFARSQRLTVSTVFQGALALVLSRLHRCGDVVFGATVAGRPADLPGVESILGSFVNNVPVRTRLPGDIQAGDWLREIQLHQQARAPFEYVSVADILRWSKLDSSGQLFDTLLVWLAPVSSRTTEELPLRGVTRGLRTGYPVTLAVAEKEKTIALELRCSAGYELRIGNEAVLRQLGNALEELTKVPARPLSDVRGSLPFDCMTPAEDPSCSVSRPAKPLPRVDVRDSETPFEDLVEESFQTILIDECRNLLGHESLGASDNFFEAGGNSLHAATLHVRIQELTGRSIPLLALFREPTIEAMAKAVQVVEPEVAGGIRPIRSSGSRPPLFCVASPEVNTIGYVLLTRHLSFDQPVYVLQSEPDEEESLFLTPSHVPDLARRYLEAMSEVQVNDPVRFVGMCGGAHVALEMARQLTRSGRDVDFVGIVNTWSFGTISWKLYFWIVRNRYRYYRRRLQSLAGLGLREQYRSMVAVLRRRVSSSAQRGNGHGSNPGASTPTSGAVMPRSWRDNYEPGILDLPPKYEGTVTVFRVKKKQFFRVNDKELGWGSRATQVEVEHLSADEHLDILREPEVRELARKLDNRLKEQTESTAGSAGVSLS